MVSDPKFNPLVKVIILERCKKLSKRDSSIQNQERQTCLSTPTVEGGKSCVKNLANKNRPICIPHRSAESKGRSVYTAHRSPGRRSFETKLIQQIRKMVESSDCSFSVIEIDSKLSSLIRLDPNLQSSDEITVINPRIEAITKKYTIFEK